MTEPIDPHVLEPGHAPTPFTGDQIRAATKVGKTLRRVVEEAGEAPYFLISRFVQVEEQTAVLERFRESLDGEPIGEPVRNEMPWLGLQRHASFAAEATTIEPETLDTPIGLLDCLRYTVRDGDEEDVFWFAKDLPGMPIQQLSRVDGEVVSTVTMVEYIAGD
ncbi:hypothetical protein F0U44_16410 [Nocardioides humilatus]|uniref:Uncharacterized protein n=1 Tax=Nocardioides humilatus TaxID=2607660 RepID=A0A5B1L972_9ACTN|nr:hypothetical protein [Nocardioides humilatus]KAA1416778.1 hypothetical protein F0U44_16410 [Nocardioides humilatus]